MKAKRAIWALAAGALWLCAAPAWAGEAVHEGFEATRLEAPGRTGKGLRAPERGFRVPAGTAERIPVDIPWAGSGTISFDLQRPASGDEGRGTVLQFTGPGGEDLFLVQVEWSSVADPARPWLRLGGDLYFEKAVGAWSPQILLDRPVAPGQWIHVDLTWDDGSATYRLYVDGREQPVPAVQYRDDGTPEPDPRLRLADAEGSPFERGPFGKAVTAARWVQIGAHTMPDDESWYTPLGNAVLDNLVIAVDEPAAPVSAVHGPEYDPKDLRAAIGPEGVTLTWEPPKVRGVNQGYRVYRREGNGRFVRLTPERVYDLTFTDTTAERG
ncbi:MAG: hypothetical protein D6708_11935, partial [Candidatus Dadabacteria bacterium]